MYPFSFQDLIENIIDARGLEFDIGAARMLRHDRRALDLWRHSPEAFEHWVSYQRPGSHSPYNKCHWAFHFVPDALPDGAYGARFVCAHRIEDRWIYGGIDADRQPRKLLRSEFERHKVEPPGSEASDLHRLHAFDELSERILVRWSDSAAGTRAWSQWWKNRKPVVAVDGRTLEELVLERRSSPVPLSPDDLDLIEDSDVLRADDGFQEGQRRLLRHWSRERNRELVARAKRVWSAREGGLRCAACGFDFAAVYGHHGVGFIEAHHTEPLQNGDGVRTTMVADLDPLCANCHRVIHRMRPMPSVEEFAAMLAG